MKQLLKYNYSKQTQNNTMTKSLFTLFFLLFAFSPLFAQNTSIKKVKYAKTEIEVPSNYTANDEYSIANDSFSAQWIYLSKEMVKQGIERQIINQFEGQLKYSEETAVVFISNGQQFSGKKYQLTGDHKLRFRVLAFGTVDGQPLILNLGLKDDPRSNAPLDELMKKFIQFEK